MSGRLTQRRCVLFVEDDLLLCWSDRQHRLQPVRSVVGVPAWT
jgi:hypothetical protein